MIEIDMDMKISGVKAENLIENLIKSEGLKVNLKGTLSKYPDSVHWHIKNDKHKGTLEITLWKNHILLKVQEGRKADWISLILPSIITALHGNKQGRRKN